MTTQTNSYRNQPDERGHFGDYGGRYVAETLMPLVLDWSANTARRRPTRLSRPSSTTCWNIMWAAHHRSISQSA